MEKYLLTRVFLCCMALFALNSVYAQPCSYPTTPVADSLFVKAVPSGTGDGSSWDNAFDGKYLAKYLREIAVDDVRIFVAAGTYIPFMAGCDTDPDPRTYAFEIRKDLVIRGGYSAASTGKELVTNWDPKNFVTRLSGEIQPDAVQTNNSYHVVVIQQNIAADISGFFISDGYADNDALSDAQNGGGILDLGGPIDTVRISFVVLENNAADFGAAIYFKSNLATILENVIIQNNNDLTSFGGAGIFAWGNFGLFNSTISNNQGHAIVSWDGDMLLRNSTITGNNGYGLYAKNNSTGKLIRMRLVSMTVTSNTSEGLRLDNEAVNQMLINIDNSLVLSNSNGLTAVDKNINFNGAFPVNVSGFKYSIVGDSLFKLTRDDRALLSQPVSLGALADNGGWTTTQALLNPCQNPAVNTGNPDLLSDPILTGIDQRGVTRSNPPCIGAYDGVNGIIIAPGASPSTIACSGASLSISANALVPNPTLPPTYQWKKDGVILFGQTAGILSFTNIQPTDAGKYTVVVSRDGSCSKESDTVFISVNPTPVVSQPGNQIHCPGESTAAVNFVSSVVGTTYSWTNDHPEVGLAASGAGSTPAFVASNTTDAPIVATITVTPSANGCTGIPVAFTITVNSKPRFSIAAVTPACAADPVATIPYINASPGSLTYSVTFSTAAISAGFQNVANASLPANQLTIPIPANLPVGFYNGQLMLTNSDGCSSIAYPFSIKINAETKILQQPRVNIFACDGSAFGVSVGATGENLRYQWFKDGNAIAGATNAVYIVRQSTIADKGSYYVEVTGACGMLQSTAATVWINIPDKLIQKWTDVLLIDNTCNCVVSYQWYKNGKAIPGATNQFYSEPGGLNGSYVALATLTDGSQYLSCEWSVFKENTATFKAYPNPVVMGASLTVDLGTEKDEVAELSIYDLTGRLRTEQRFNGRQLSVPIDLPQGIYILQIKTPEGVQNQKFIVR